MSEQLNETAHIEWVEVSPNFGSNMPYGSCNARVGDTVCGYPRRADGTCTAGHPAMPTPPGMTD